MTAIATATATATVPEPILPDVTFHAAIDRDTLASALAVAVKSTNRKSRLPILGMVHLETVGPDAATGRPAGIRVSATDLETATDQVIPAASGWDGAAVIPAAELLAFVKAAPRGAIVDLTARNLAGRYMVDAYAGGPTATFVGLDPLEYPTGAHTMDGAAYVATVRAQDLRIAFGRTLYAAAGYGARPVLCAVSMTFNGYDAEVATADNYRLAVTNVGATMSDAPVAAAFADRLQILPYAKGADLVASAIGARGTGTVTISHDARKCVVAFAIDNGPRIIVRAADGRFPRYDQVIPADMPDDVVATVNVGALRAALRAALPVAKGSGGSVVIAFDTDGLGIGAGAGKGANGAATGASYDATVPATVTGPDGMRAAFSCTYLVDALSPMADSDTAVIRTNSPLHPARIRDARDPFPGPLAVVMPIRMLESRY